MKWPIIAIGVACALYSPGSDNLKGFDSPYTLVENISSYPQPLDICLGDFDSDNDLDIAVANAAGIRFFENINGKYESRGLIFKAPYKNPDVDVSIDCKDINMDSADEIVFAGPAGIAILSYKDEPLGDSPYSWEGSHSERRWDVVSRINLNLKHYKAGTDVKIIDVNKDGIEDIVLGTPDKIMVFPAKE